MTLGQAIQAVAPLARVCVRVWATYRVDYVVTLALNCSAVPPVPVLGFVAQRWVRLWVAARLNSPRPKQQRVEEASADDQEGAADAGSASSQQPAAPTRTQKKLGGPRGLPPLPPRSTLRTLLPSPDHSTQPLGLPLNLLGQAAARGPMYRYQGNRLLRGVLGLAATLLLCRGVPTPFTGRRAWLPPRLFELVFHKVLGPVAAMSYILQDPTQLAGGPSLQDKALCQSYTPALQQAYQRMRAAGAAEADRLGRSVAFAAPSAAQSVQAIPSGSVNACCFPGGLVMVNSALIQAVGGSSQALSFVVGHEVGHAIGRHSLEKATLTYAGMFGIDIVVGLVERLLKGLERAGQAQPATRPSDFPPGAYPVGALGRSAGPAYPAASAAFTSTAAGLGRGQEGGEVEEEEGECSLEPGAGGSGSLACRVARGLDAALQCALYLAQLAQSRRHEYEADAMALHLGAHAGMDRAWLAGGAEHTLQKFIRTEAGPLSQLGLSQPRQQGDNPLSTHPAATNRLRAITRLFRSGAT